MFFDLEITPDDEKVLAACYEAYMDAVRHQPDAKPGNMGWLSAKRILPDQYLVYDWQKLVNAGLLFFDSEMVWPYYCIAPDGIAAYRTLVNLRDEKTAIIQNQGVEIGRLKAQIELLENANQKLNQELRRRNASRLAHQHDQAIDTLTAINKVVLQALGEPTDDVGAWYYPEIIVRVFELLTMLKMTLHPYTELHSTMRDYRMLVDLHNRIKKVLDDRRE